jgi:riboflavin synthase
VRVPADFASNVVPKGSITIDGISLTVARWSDNVAAVAVIPYTYEHTNIRDRKPGDAVNLEGDILGKYIERHLAARASAAGEGDSTLSMTRLVEEGF